MEVTQMVTNRIQHSVGTPVKQGSGATAPEPNRINASTPFDFPPFPPGDWSATDKRPHAIRASACGLLSSARSGERHLPYPADRGRTDRSPADAGPVSFPAAAPFCCGLSAAL